jgi:hypothetical protein
MLVSTKLDGGFSAGCARLATQPLIYATHPTPAFANGFFASTASGAGSTPGNRG